MVLSESTTSIRIVSVDHYMHKPEVRFDTCYSEFRGCDVKQVPVIRLFGSTSDGVHSCVHIHGVFPYLYVPYDGTGTDRLAVDRFMYQLASGLDKAINVSLGNASSTKSHVFRIALVKGTPIYGYHRKEHLFLKIYLYNPHFIRKATTLLMNGVILSRVFQTYETHIPYILQFFIDYNLYGMSFLRVPTKAICERIGSDAELPKMSTSEYEIDIQAVDILNRTTLEQGKQSEYANPGIASIWDDECARRRLLGLEQPVAVSLSQSGKTEIVTESDRFYRSVLISKLNEKQRRVSQSSQAKDVKRVKPPVSFYPSEIGDKEQLLDASCIQNHKSFTQMSFANCSNVRFDLFSDSVDEDRIISMSQNPDASFVEEDHELLGIMRELEENENNERDGDSLLAPLTQLSQNRVPCTAGSLLELSQSGNRRLNATLSGNLETVSMMESRTEEGEVAELERQLLEGDLTLDSDDEFLLDYTSKLDLQPEMSNEGNLLNASDDDMLMNIIPQLDGAVDDLTLAPIAKRNRSNGTFTDSTAPPVNGVQTNGLEPEIKRSRRSRELKAETGSEPVKRSLSNGSPAGPLSPRTRKKIRGEQNGLQLINGQSTPEKQPPPKLKELKIRLSKMDFSSYRLPPSDSPQKEPKRDLSPYDEFRLAREYDLANNWDPQEGLSSGTKRGRGRSKKPKPKPAIQQPKPKRRTPFKQRLQPEEIDVVLSQRFQNIIKLSPKVLLKPLSQQEMAHLKEKPAQVATSDTACELANISDKLSRSADSATWSHLSEIPMETNQKVVCSPIAPLQPESEEPEEIEDLNIESFYEKTLAFDDFDEIGSTSDESLTGYQLGSVTGSDEKVVIALQEKPPSFGDALKAVHDFAIPKVVHQEPFYGDPADITGRKEVGHVVLNIGGNSFNDLEEFRSVVPGLSSLNQLRYEKLCSIYGEDIDQVVGDPRSRSGSGKIKELVTSNRAVAIHLAAKPPSKHEAKVWLKAIESIKSEDLAASIEQDSPIKIKKMQAIMVGDDATNMETQSSTKSKIDHDSALNLSSLISADSQLDCSSRKSLVSKIFSMNTTRSSPALAGDQLPASADRLQLPSYSARRKRSKNAGKARLSLSTTFKRLRSATKEEPTSSAFMETSVSEETIAQVPAPLLEDGMDIIASSQARTNSQKSNENGSNQSTLPHSAEIASMKQRLLGEEPMIANDSQTVGDNSGNISATTQLGNTFGFKVNFENLQKAKATCEYNHLAIMSVEIHVQTRGELCPNPEIDPISAMFYRIHNDVPEDHRRAPSVCGIILNREHADGKTVEPPAFKYNKCIYTADVVTVANERELYEKFLMLISFWDPDIFAGYEIEQASWGYIIQRGYALEMNLMKMLSRVPTAEKVHVSEEEEQDLLEMHEYSAGLKIPGRILLDIWRLMRHEIALTSYSFENIVYHILHRRVPRHSFRLLTRLWNKPYSKWIVYEYYLERVNGNLELLQQLDLIGRTAELAKLFGIQFYEVLSRGSQFRVESMMLRIAKPRNFVSLSPSIQQRAHMRAPEYLPLILEPGSRFYADPLIVLDFQSLYPSMIIAYNYCFSTCLGRVEHLGEGESEPFEFGASQLKLSRKLLQFLVDNNLITISPCGVAFVKASVREGVLPRMLNEILTTRLMVKGSMKLHKENRVLQRVLHSRQLGLKLIANVTYGYTAANFSGRMPCVEVGDSVVSKGRETLERAIKMVESTERWGAKVVYGDTDSLFVLCPGRTKEDAFQIGEEIVEAVTRDNPPPVKLKLEKVYQPCILQTKKRYVGYMYETADQEKPVYEAKGIETVRRDGCPVVGKMLEKVLRILFETRDVSKVKEYTCRQFTKILEGRVNLQDFIFAKEFRGEDGYKPGACVPALELTRRWKLVDPRREPRRGERVPYVIVNGPPLVPLIRLVRSPDELLADSGLKINSNYYISKAIIPPLNRCLLLIGADVHQWYNDLPRKFLMLHNTGGKSSSLASALQLPKKSTISQYFSTTSCIGDCGQQTHRGVCDKCLQNPQRTVCYVADKINRLERRVELGEKMCKSCCQRSFETACISLDCPIVFVLNQRKREHDQVQYYRNLVEELF
ncbi:DNA polymerase zeta catalytic subunit [Sabethes cyaneus]|uniref:DNA polymerase zeta catalytic subunit n=1 Tax=Sabethes cyaneus TaxID=53552 RepID=UPI00237EBCA3|nr:DNA polymerase zeta catalytic subunit [Sabethes cyaneus]